MAKKQRAFTQKELNHARFRGLFLEKLSLFVVSAFGLVAALAWNDAIQNVFKSYFPPYGTMISQISYAVFVTIVGVWVAYLLARARGQ